ncbi:MAG: MATE family efflux transporter [Sphingomonadaceae bacterium]|nr:MATE family efflux transporter [Sphingomonadaceae bacterium]
MSGADTKQRGDLTSGPILRTLLIFSIPTLASNLLQSLNGTVNAIWVGKLLGEEALAATANANIILFLLAATVFGFGMAATVKIGQHFGGKRIEAARKTMGTAVGFCGGMALLTSAVGWSASPYLLDMMGTPGEAADMANTYLRWIFISTPPVMVFVMLSMGLRGAGDARTPLIFMAVVVGLDIILNPILIAGLGPVPALGIAGSAIATVIANLIGFVAMVAYIYARDLPLRLRGRELAWLRPRREELGYILTKGLPMGAQMMIMSAAGLIMIGLVNKEGLTYTAAYGASMQLWTYVQMPAMAIGAAVSAMAAQAIGAGKWDRLEATTRAGIMVNFVITGSLCVLLVLLDHWALGLFLPQGSESVAIGEQLLLIGVWGFILFGATVVFFGTMRAGGAVVMPVVILVVALYPARLGFYELTYGWLGPEAIWWSFPVGSVVSATLAWIAYRRPGWREAARAENDLEAAEQSGADADPAGRFKPNL